MLSLLIEPRRAWLDVRVSLQLLMLSNPVHVSSRDWYGPGVLSYTYFVLGRLRPASLLQVSGHRSPRILTKLDRGGVIQGLEMANIAI